MNVCVAIIAQALGAKFERGSGGAPAAAPALTAEETEAAMFAEIGLLPTQRYVAPSRGLPVTS